MISILITIINALARVLSLIVIADVLLSYFMSPWHPVKRTLDRIVEPMLSPIRRVVPPLGMIDFSPLVLLILIQLAQYLLVQLLFFIR
ncbi:MAG TPA: YggT family protein [Anaerolineaceae bacterium]|nr:YggT family protein [Anaerolineaceae bacterium]